MKKWLPVVVMVTLNCVSSILTVMSPSISLYLEKGGAAGAFAGLTFLCGLASAVLLFGWLPKVWWAFEAWAAEPKNNEE